MKYLVCSDIHGSSSNCEKLAQAFKNENADYILLLGDILYHGPRNNLPENYEPKKCIEILNPLADKILCCRGNCDADVEEMVLDFSVLETYSTVLDSGVKIFCTHGHIFSPLNENGDSTVVAGSKLPRGKQDIILYGHTHVSKLYLDKNQTLVMNPGSPSIPKENTVPGYGILEIKSDSSGKAASIRAELKSFDGSIIKTLEKTI